MLDLPKLDRDDIGWGGRFLVKRAVPQIRLGPQGDVVGAALLFEQDLRTFRRQAGDRIGESPVWNAVAPVGSLRIVVKL